MTVIRDLTSNFNPGAFHTKYVMRTVTHLHVICKLTLQADRFGFYLKILKPYFQKLIKKSPTLVQKSLSKQSCDKLLFSSSIGIEKQTNKPSL